MPIAALSLLAMAHLFDFVTFLVMTSRHGLAAEFNPVVVTVAQDYGLPGLTLAKAATVIFLSVTVVLLGTPASPWDGVRAADRSGSRSASSAA